MAAVAAAGGRSLVGRAVAALGRRRRPARAAAVVAAVREHVVTVAALVSADLGGWHWGAGIGWLVTAASLLALDFAVRG